MDRQCSATGCDRPIIAYDLCHTHYKRVRKFGDANHGGVLPPSNWGVCRVGKCNNAAGSNSLCPLHDARRLRNGAPTNGRRSPGSEVPPCKIQDCGKPAKSAHGLCYGHYHRLQNYGDPLGSGTQRIVGNDAARFWSKVDKGAANGCWIWRGTKTHSHRDGKAHQWTYGAFSVTRDGKQRRLRAHRFAYELLTGPIPEGAQLDHLCRNTLCVNPAHLEPVTNAENSARGIAAQVNRARQLAKTHCKRGHPLSGKNLYIQPGNGQRVCRECNRLRESERRKQRRSQHQN